jgi:hypothetical protein
VLLLAVGWWLRKQPASSNSSSSSNNDPEANEGHGHQPLHGTHKVPAAFADQGSASGTALGPSAPPSLAEPEPSAPASPAGHPRVSPSAPPAFWHSNRMVVVHPTPSIGEPISAEPLPASAPGGHSSGLAKAEGGMEDPMPVAAQ